MENNIFEGAKFGDKFITNKNHILVFQKEQQESIYEHKCYIVFNEYNYHKVNSNGTFVGYEYDGAEKIISKYQESIDEDKLDELALNIYNMCGETPECLMPPEHPNKEIYDWMTKCFNTMIWGIKLGYKKAKEE